MEKLIANCHNLETFTKNINVAAPINIIVNKRFFVILNFLLCEVNGRVKLSQLSNKLEKDFLTNTIRELNL